MSRSARAALAATLLAGCAPAPEPVDYSAYTPFDPANMASQLARLESHATIAALRTTATPDNAATVFAEIESEYTANDLQVKVAGRTDDHLEAEGYGVADLGVFLDGHIGDAIDLGAGAETEAEVAWAGQVVEKALLVFFYYSVYHELQEHRRETLDEAYGYSGLGLDGKAVNGLATVAEGREDEFAVPLVRPIFESLVEARHAMAEGTESIDEVLTSDDPLYEGAIATIDEALLRTLGLYVVHELDEVDETNADVKLIEARVAWEGVQAWGEHVDPTTTTAIWVGLYPGGVPERDAEGYFWSGLDDVRSGAAEVDVGALRADLATLLAALD